MANRSFTRLSDMFRHIEQNYIKPAMETDVADVVRMEQQKQIENVVYNAYPEPYVYERRRFNGGLQDADLMVAEIGETADGIVLSVVNLAKGKDEDIYIAPLVEHGDGKGYGEYQYKYNRSKDSWKYLQSRPFTAATIDALKRSGVHIKALKEGLRRRGLDVR